jgi:hypothetical protein
MTMHSYRHSTAVLWAISLLCGGAFVPVAPSVALAAGVVGTGTAASCTDAALDTALASGGLVTFNCGGRAMIDISGKTIAADTTVDGGGVITLSGGSPAFNIDSGVEFTLHNLRIAGGVGGLFAQDGASVIVTHSEFTGIIGDGPFGEGIMMVGNGTLSVTASTFTGSTTGIGLTSNGPSHGSATVTNSTFTDNDAGNRDGGGIENVGWTLAVTNSTFIGNRAGAGGGIENAGGTLSVINCTFSGNNGQVGGGGINNIIEAGAGPVTVANSIFSANTSDNCNAPITDSGHNLDDGTSCGFSSAKGSLINTNPQLDPLGLQNNGGPTETVALCAGAGVPAGCTAASPAIDAGDQAICAAAPVNNLDQRGFVRPGTGHTQCSIGAYEADAVPSMVTATPSDTPPTITATPTETSTTTTAIATPTAKPSCTGDCDGNGVVAINELILGVNIVLAIQPVDACPAFANAEGVVDIAQLIKGVNNALNGCGG